MIPVLMVWLYFALLISVMQWPNVLSMLFSFVFLAGIPLFMLYRLLVAKRRNSRGGGDKAGESVHPGMGEVDQENSGENE